LLRLVGRLRTQVHKCPDNGMQMVMPGLYAMHKTTAVFVRPSQQGGFTAFLLYDNDDETQALVRANRVDTHGSTPDEALLNLIAILKEKHKDET
jgi:hypothetical protein